MNTDWVTRRLQFIHTCQQSGQSWLKWVARIIFVHILDRMCATNPPGPVWVDFLPHIGEGGLIVIGVTNSSTFPQSISGRLLSDSFRQRILSRRWGQGLIPITADDLRSVLAEAAEHGSGIISDDDSPALPSGLDDLSTKSCRQIVGRTKGQFRIHSAAFERAMAAFEQEEESRREGEPRKKKKKKGP